MGHDFSLKMKILFYVVDCKISQNYTLFKISEHCACYKWFHLHILSIFLVRICRSIWYSSLRWRQFIYWNFAIHPLLQFSSATKWSYNQFFIINCLVLQFRFPPDSGCFMLLSNSLNFFRNYIHRLPWRVPENWRWDALL